MPDPAPAPRRLTPSGAAVWAAVASVVLTLTAVNARPAISVARDYVDALKAVRADVAKVASSVDDLAKKSINQASTLERHEKGFTSLTESASETTGVLDLHDARLTTGDLARRAIQSDAASLATRVKAIEDRPAPAPAPVPVPIPPAPPGPPPAPPKPNPVTVPLAAVLAYSANPTDPGNQALAGVIGDKSLITTLKAMGIDWYAQYPYGSADLARTQLAPIFGSSTAPALVIYDTGGHFYGLDGQVVPRTSARQTPPATSAAVVDAFKAIRGVN